MTPNDLLPIARRAFPAEHRFVWVIARHTHPVPTYLEAGDRLQVAGVDAVITEWECDPRGRRLRAELGAWLPTKLLRERWAADQFRRAPVQPSPPSEKWRP